MVFRKHCTRQRRSRRDGCNSNCACQKPFIGRLTNRFQIRQGRNVSRRSEVPSREQDQGGKRIRIMAKPRAGTGQRARSGSAPAGRHKAQVAQDFRPLRLPGQPARHRHQAVDRVHSGAIAQGAIRDRQRLCQRLASAPTARLAIRKSLSARTSLGSGAESRKLIGRAVIGQNLGDAGRQFLGEGECAGIRWGHGRWNAGPRRR